MHRGGNACLQDEMRKSRTGAVQESDRECENNGGRGTNKSSPEDVPVESDEAEPTKTKSDDTTRREKQDVENQSFKKQRFEAATREGRIAESIEQTMASVC